MKQKLEIRNFNLRLVILLITISVMGLVAIGSAKASVQTKQAFGVVFGVFVMLVIAFFDYHFTLKFYWLIYFFNMGLLILVDRFGDSSHNAQRWIEIAGIRFQPSETAKILLILFYAQFIMKNRERINDIRIIGIMIGLILPPLYLVYKQPDLSTTIMLVIIFCMILYVGGLSHKIIIGTLAVVVPAVVVVIFLILQPDQTLVKPYQQERVLAWLQPDKYALTTAYQQQNSITAIGSGQLWGKGLNNNEIGSVKNGNYISEPQTDFIFAIIGEETGFVGSAAVIVLLMLIAAECFRTGMNAADLSGQIICFGMGSIICFQSFINVGVTTGLLPNTGLPLPFVSYGLTSLVSLYAGMGFVLSVSLRKKTQERKTVQYVAMPEPDFNQL
ncbi:MAG: rod shape-determining protein RodA [Lachnospiraceae bacterium]|nr:rod shape-determining protein RodA [Lachnospiraceae bacterium]